MSFMDLCLLNFSLLNFFIDDMSVQLFLQTNDKLSLSGRILKAPPANPRT